MTHDEFKKLFDEYYIPCFLYAVHLTKSPFYDSLDPEDIAQEVFIKLWKNQGEVPVGREKVFLFKCIKNKVSDVTKLKRNQDKMKKGVKYFQMYQEEELIRIEAIVFEKLYDGHKNLPESCRKVFELYWIGKTTHEIMGILKTTQQNVLNQKQRAIRLLQQVIKSCSI